MKIGLFDIDSKIPNLALMKISAIHKGLGDSVERYSPIFHSAYDIIYASKIFNYPHPNDHYIRADMIKGGPGFDLYFKLPETFDHIYPDYSLYPDCDYSMGYITKGCIRQCEFCIVPKMEGMIYKFADLKEFCKEQEKVMLLDNNILAYIYHIKELDKLISSGKKFNFTQGLDIRLVNKTNAKKLKKIPRWNGLRLKFAFDNPDLKNLIERKLKILNDVGISNGTIEFYVLIGFNTSHEEDLMRIHLLRDKGISAFAMPFNKLDPYQKKFARWVNRRFYKYCTFEQYQQGKIKV